MLLGVKLVVQEIGRLLEISILTINFSKNWGVSPPNFVYLDKN